MSAATSTRWTRIETCQESPTSWRLLKSVRFEIGGLPSPTATVIEVPEGYTCDLASVPRLMRGLVNRDALAPAALLHDYLLFIGYMRVVADALFYEAACASEGVSKKLAGAAYAGVRAWSILHSLRR